MSLKNVGSAKSLPNLDMMEVNVVPDFNFPKHDVKSDMGSRRSRRTAKKTWKDREDLEVDFWHLVTIAK